MSISVYTALSRQDGLSKELELVANNLANSSTVGYKADRAIFVEYITPAGPDQPSVSMGTLAAHAFELSQSALKFTGGQFDVALQGEGYFQIETDQGIRLSRAGNFQLSNEGVMIDPFGNPVLGFGGPITIPENASSIQIGGDGTISADGQLVDQIALVVPNGELRRDTNTMFIADGGTDQAEAATLIQGALEQSNVSPVLEIARLIEVQRAYEAGQAMLEKEDQRVSQAITTLRNR